MWVYAWGLGQAPENGDGAKAPGEATDVTDCGQGTAVAYYSGSVEIPRQLPRELWKSIFDVPRTEIGQAKMCRDEVRAVIQIVGDVWRHCYVI